MGYFTDYKLEIHQDPKNQTDEIEKYFTADENEDEYWYNLLDGACDSMKWYNHDDDMLHISRLWPDVVFRLEGNGEENWDWWVKYYKNGKMQTCRSKITFGEFDEQKLE